MLIQNLLLSKIFHHKKYKATDKAFFKYRREKRKKGMRDI